MIAFLLVLFVSAAAMFVMAVGIALYDVWLGSVKAVQHVGEDAGTKPARWRTTAALAVLAWTPLLVVVGVAAARARA